MTKPDLKVAASAGIKIESGVPNPATPEHGYRFVRIEQHEAGALKAALGLKKLKPRYARSSN